MVVAIFVADASLQLLPALYQMKLANCIFHANARGASGYGDLCDGDLVQGISDNRGLSSRNSVSEQLFEQRSRTVWETSVHNRSLGFV